MRLATLNGRVVELRRIQRVKGARMISLPRLILRLWGDPKELIVKTDFEKRQITLELPEGEIDKAGEDI